MSNALLEAMATGLPIVATEVGDNAVVVRSGKEGRIVAAHRPQVTAETLIMLASRPELRERFGLAARRRAKQYDFPRMVQAYESYYQALSPSPSTGTRPPSRPGRPCSPVISSNRSIHERLQRSVAGPTFALKRH